MALTMQATAQRNANGEKRGLEVEDKDNAVEIVVVQCSRNNPAAGLIAHLSCSHFSSLSCVPRSSTLSSTSVVPEESFPHPVATKAPADTQSTAADHPQPQTNSQAPQPFISDPRRAPKWLKLPGMF